MAAKTNTFRAFNGLRLFAALGVVCYHYGQEVAGFKSLPGFLQNLVLSGPIAISFFFLLSGFVLAYAYASRIPATGADRRKFWLARFARLYPVYLLGFVLFLPVAVEKYLRHPAPGLHASDFFYSLAFTLPGLQAWTPFSRYWNGPGWSLSVEAFFYFLFPFAVRLVLRMPWARLLAMLLPMWVAMLLVTQAASSNILPVDLWHNWVQCNPLLWTPLFLLGIALYRLYSERISVHPVGFAKALTSTTPAAVTAILTLATLLLLCGLLPPYGRQLLLYGGAAPLLALLILALAHPTSVASKAFGSRALFNAGAASYITYITQAPVWDLYVFVTSHLAHHASAQGVSPWQFWTYLPGLILFSLVVQSLIEEPAQRYLLSQRVRVPLLADPAIEAV